MSSSTQFAPVAAPAAATAVAAPNRPLVTTSCASKRTTLPRPQAVSVNGVVIPREDIARETQNHPAGNPREAWVAAARALVVRELLIQEARRVGIVACPKQDEAGRRETPDEALIRQLVEREAPTPDVDEATCRRFYDGRRATFRSSDLYAVRHILFPATPKATADRTAAREAALTVITELTDAPERFAALAAAHSACPSRDLGGDLGQISHGQTVPEFEAALAAAPVGRIAPDPIETRYGYHVVQVDRRMPGREVPFEAVRDQIAGWLAESGSRTAIRRYLGMLAGRAVIDGVTLDDTPQAGNA